MSSHLPPPEPGVGPGSRSRRYWSWRRWPWCHWDRGDAIAWGAVAVVVVAAVLVVVASVYAAGGGVAGPGGTVDLQGVPGQVSIVAVYGGRVRLTGQLHWTGHAAHPAALVFRGHVLWLVYR